MELLSLLRTILFELLTTCRCTVLGWGSMGWTRMYRGGLRCRSVLLRQILGILRVQRNIIRETRSSSLPVKQRPYSQRDRHFNPRPRLHLFTPMEKQFQHRRVRTDLLLDRLWKLIELLSSFMPMALRTSSRSHTSLHQGQARQYLHRHGWHRLGWQTVLEHFHHHKDLLLLRNYTSKPR
jgi:hypothetical protein